MISIRLIAVGLGLLAGVAWGQPESPLAFQGLWMTEDGKGVYKVGRCGEGLCASIVGVKPHVDSKGKPDASCGLQVLTLPAWSGEKNRWEGKVVDPSSRKSYSASLELGKGGNPVMRASWGLIRFSDKWTRFTGSVGDSCEIK